MEPQLSSLSFTHVTYDASSLLGVPAAIFALVPQIAVVAYITLIYARREFDLCFAFAGQLGNELLNAILKRHFKELRPAGERGIGQGYGMPSSHAQFMGFLASVIVFSLLYSLDAPPSLSPRSGSGTGSVCSKGPGNGSGSGIEIGNRMAAGIKSTGICVMAGLVCLSRIYLAYHTPNQVLAGVSIGILTGISWSTFLVFMKRVGFVNWLLDLFPVRLLRIKDGSISLDDALYSEWLESRQKRQNKINRIKAKRP